MTAEAALTASQIVVQVCLLLIAAIAVLPVVIVIAHHASR